MNLVLTRVFLGLSVFAAVIVCLLIYTGYNRPAGAASRSPARSAAVARATMGQSYGKLPQRFEVNRGQTRSRAKFISRGKGFAVFLEESGAEIHLRNESAAHGPRSATLRMKLVGAGSVTVAGNTFTVWQEVNPCAVPNFILSPMIAAGRAPLAMATADFNKDGKPDLAVGSDSNKIITLSGDGQGGFGGMESYASYGDLQAITTGDFNNDGNIDLAAAVFGQGDNVVVLFGNGGGQFGNFAAFSPSGRPSDIAAADFNGDNKLDLAVVNEEPNTISVLFGTGTGSFGQALTLGGLSTTFRPRSIAVGDFNGDGRADLITSNPDRSNGNGLLALMAGDGAGGFSAARSYTAPSQPVQALDADFTGDGKTDLIILGGTCALSDCANNGSVLLRIGDGNGRFETAAEFTVGNNPKAMTIGDFNHDNKPDVAVANGGSNDVSILLNNGTGGFGNAANIAVSEMPQAIATGDFNNDGNADLAVTM
jgi:hypothetical protein